MKIDNKLNNSFYLSDICKEVWKKDKTEIFKKCFFEDIDVEYTLLGHEFKDAWEKAKKDNSKYNLLLIKFRQFDHKNPTFTAQIFFFPYLVRKLISENNSPTFDDLDKLLFIQLFKEEFSLPSNLFPRKDEFYRFMDDKDYKLNATLDKLFPFISSFFVLDLHNKIIKNFHKDWNNFCKNTNGMLDENTFSPGKSVNTIIKPLISIIKKLKVIGRVY